MGSKITDWFRDSMADCRDTGRAHTIMRPQKNGDMLKIRIEMIPAERVAEALGRVQKPKKPPIPS